ncbi:hypothetical protein H9P43_007592 [Blastocladiella emersonii ATCC 22665]|nr:hypothetical protein H9P43_007592 [Blastocladiella emersonii ATCC 22665]
MAISSGYTSIEAAAAECVHLGRAVAGSDSAAAAATPAPVPADKGKGKGKGKAKPAAKANEAVMSASRAASLVSRLAATDATLFVGTFIHNPESLRALPVDSHGTLLLYIHSSLLQAALQAPDVRQRVFLHAAEFIEAVQGEDLRCAPQQAKNMAQALLNLGAATSPCAVLRPLVTLTHKFAQPHAITSIHQLVLKACLLANHFKAALPLLTTPMEQVQQPINVRDVLLYQYYGGMVWTGLKEYQRAMEFFRFTLAVPSTALSHIQAAALKKLILVSLIHTGKTPDLPKGTFGGGSVLNMARGATEAYWALGSALTSGPATNAEARLAHVVDKHLAEFARADNLGLVRQVVRAAPQLAVKRLTETYLTLSLRDMARQTAASFASGGDAAAAVEREVAHMVAVGKVRATIGHAPQPAADDPMGEDALGTVAFLDDDDKFDDAATAAGLAQRIAQALDTGARVRAAEKQVVLTAKAGGPSRSGSLGGAGAAGALAEMMMGGMAGASAGGFRLGGPGGMMMGGMMDDAGDAMDWS